MKGLRLAQPLRAETLLMRSEIASVVTYISRYGNAIVNGREKNQWSKSIIDYYCQGFSEQVRTMRMLLYIFSFIFGWQLAKRNRRDGD